MRKFVPLALFSLVCLPGPSFRAEETAEALLAPEESPTHPDPIALRITELGDDAFRVREQAERALWEVGDAAVPALREAVGSEDPEIAHRARNLLEKADLSIRPDTDPQVVALVERFLKSGANARTVIFNELGRRRAWRQMLRLYSHHADAELRDTLKPAVEAISILAARDRLLAGEPNVAREFLEMAPADDAGLRALAAFHHFHGSIQEEIKRCEELKEPRQARWLLALHRASGDLQAARSAAEAAEENRTAAALAILAGDPLPWLRLPAADANTHPAIRTYPALAAKRFQGTNLKKSDLAPISRLLHSQEESDRWMSALSLSLLGENTAAEKALESYDPSLVFELYESAERIDAALRSLDLDPAAPDYSAWLRERIARLEQSDADEQMDEDEREEIESEALSELLLLANFMERRGLHDELDEAIREPFLQLARDQPNRFPDHLSMLYGDGDEKSAAPLAAWRISRAWASENPGLWVESRICAFGEDESMDEWWALLEKIIPGMGPDERLRAMLALFRFIPDPDRLRERVFEACWNSLEGLPDAARLERLTIMLSAAFSTDDAASGLKIWDAIPAEDQAQVRESDGYRFGSHLDFLAAAERWEDAANLILGELERMAAHAGSGNTTEFHAYAAACLRLAGRPDEAAEQDRLASMLALGEPERLLGIGQGYAFGHDYQRAAEWWMRAAMMADPDSDTFRKAIYQLGYHSMEIRNWKLAASCYEFLSFCASLNLIEISSARTPVSLRFQADLARAMANMPENSAAALARLEAIHRHAPTDASLADHFFPALRESGHLREHDAWFERSWNAIEAVITRFPQSDNTRNAAGWLASRANRRLQEAEIHLHAALRINPFQAAYLDTLAEIHFASGDRHEALRWSRLSMAHEPTDSMIRRQHHRFLHAPFPL